jgi:hypothetical protein
MKSWLREVIGDLIPLLIFFCMLWHDENLNRKIRVHKDGILGGSRRIFHE